jgi:hypothetical protein
LLPSDCPLFSNARRHINKIRRDWQTNEVFKKFLSQVAGMSNPKLKSLKEGMVDSFFRKMRSQVEKHNKRYLLSRSIIRSVFAEWQTGQAVAQVLKGGDGMPALSAPFFSKQHGREIDCVKFSKFLKDGIPLTVLDQLRTDPAIQFNQNAIDQIAVRGIDIWDVALPTNENTQSLRRHALHAYAAHASTQHNNERLVKLGALMASTGKSEIMASIFAIASNDFMQEYKDKEETHQEPANQPAEAPIVAVEEAGPQRRKRGNRSGKKKLFDLQQVVLKKEQELQGVARHLGPEMFLVRSKRIFEALTSKEENLREKISKAKSRKMMAHIDENKPSNARQRKQGEDLPPRLLGYFPYQPMGRKANMSELEKELEAREISFDRRLTVTRKLKILKEKEPLRLEAQVEAELGTRGYQSLAGLKLPAKIQLLRQDMEEKEEHAGGEYDVDITKFFKLVSTSVDQSIFED